MSAEAPILHIASNNGFFLSYIHIQHRVNNGSAFYWDQTRRNHHYLEHTELVVEKREREKREANSQLVTKGCYLKETHITSAHVLVNETCNMANMDVNRAGLWGRRGESSMIFLQEDTAYIFEIITQSIISGFWLFVL